MTQFRFLLREVAAGKSLVRSCLNDRLREEILSGAILDLGSGGSDRYSNTVARAAGASYHLFDRKRGQGVDFESDQLPYEDKVFDTILLFNVLEHIYNHKWLLSEVRRIKKEDGILIGYVPFLMWYHPDHRDYFRYTHEALDVILRTTGYRDIVIETLYWGPYTTAFQMIHTTVPRFLRPLLLAPCYALDALFRKLRPTGAARYALGYYFKAR